MITMFCNQDSPRLPIELLSLIGEFVAGSNNFASLSKYSLTCRLLHEELQRILYETVIAEAPSDYKKGDEKLEWLLNPPKDSLLCSGFKYTKYVC